jgi:hypothetical protein
MHITDEPRNLRRMYSRHMFRISEGISYINQRPPANGAKLHTSGNDFCQPVVKQPSG